MYNLLNVLDFKYTIHTHKNNKHNKVKLNGLFKTIANVNNDQSLVNILKTDYFLMGSKQEERHFLILFYMYITTLLYNYLFYLF